VVLTAVARAELQLADSTPVDERTLAMIRRGCGARRRRGWLVRRLLLAADVLGLGLAFVCSQAVFGGEGVLPGSLRNSAELGLFVATILPGWVVAAKVYGLYDRDEERADTSTADDLAGVFQLTTLGAWLLVAGAWATGFSHPDLGKVTLFWALAVLLVSLGRAVARTVCRRSSSYVQNTVIVGADETGMLVARKLQQHPEYGINLLGFADSCGTAEAGGLPVLDAPDRLPELVSLLHVDRVIVAFPQQPWDETLRIIRQLREREVQVDFVPRFYEVMSAQTGIHTVEGMALVALPPVRLSRSSRLVKRAVDVSHSAAALILLAPVLALIGLLVKLDSRGPVLFRQTRMGAADQPFEIFKFRTMVVDADARKTEFAHLNEHAQNGGDPRMFKIHRDPRATRVGQVLRRTSLDELPQLWNVLRGDMSLVGPRPLILDEHENVDDWALRRLDLKPGITGLWQVLGRSDIPFEEMLRLDYVYVTSWSLWSDLRIVLRTFPTLVGRSGGAY
jgi:exopolysaccharide biosynthesis polyprenyl glycosylphosphotransferase